MRILFLAEGNAESWESWSGISKSLVDHLRAAGHTVHVGDVDLRGSDRWTAAAATVSLGRRRWGTRYHLTGVPFRLRSRQAHRHIAVWQHRIDLILQVGSTFESRGVHGIPYCLCCDSNVAVARQGESTGFSDTAALTPADVAGIVRREAAVYREASAIFPLSERLRRSFINEFGIPADRVTAIHAGPNLDLGSIEAAVSSRADSTPPTVLFVGRQFHRKGGDLLVESFRRVLRLIPDARLVIAGQPVGFVGGPGITCIGDLDKDSADGWSRLVAAYTSADVFALPTRFEPFGIAFIEAMHFGLPCIGPDAWAIPEIIADGETGFAVPIDEVDALTDRLVRLLTNRNVARAMGEAGRRRARSLFTWPRVVERMLHVMTPLVRSEERPACSMAS
jgi:glycosyltransferase involved in cell wall biosynthesis